MMHTGMIASDDTVGMAVASMVACLYPIAIAFTRMYTGLHSPQDVYGGAFLGLIVLVLANPLLPRLDAFLETASFWEAATLIFGGAITLVIAHPQPRPMTVTFLHDCEMMGLAVSCAFGSWLHKHDVFASSISAVVSPYGSACGPAVKAVAGPYAVAALRVVVGLGVTGVCYLVAKHLGSFLLQLATGISASKVRKAIEKSEPPQNKYSQRIANHVIERLTASGDPLRLLDLVDPVAIAAAAARSEASDDSEGSSPAPVGEEAPAPGLRVRRPRRSSGSRKPPPAASAGKDPSPSTLVLSPIADEDEEELPVSYTEVPIRIVPDEPPMRGLELGVAAAVKLFTYTCVGVAIIGLSPGVQSGLGLEPNAYS
jgi:hypothetical protein